MGRFHVSRELTHHQRHRGIHARPSRFNSLPKGLLCSREKTEIDRMVRKTLRFMLIQRLLSKQVLLTIRSLSVLAEEETPTGDQALSLVAT
ncbi:hypothetical protein KIN20_017067 [Parelaphostrongylus tenuis]|uniref:Uncharacterized protein n=1 Tax=Parelaphostrongylus tenuis TaxID=148309 RepID=A0AAD5MI28_PARTN|nr:hypothetical protein KIN20_017067 [Parelaphostrongylus tenuis]